MEDENIMFNIYYVNLLKIYELSMMINNIIPREIEDKRQLKSSFSMLNKFQYGPVNLEGGLSTSTNSSRSINFEIKNTKSIFLRNIIKKATIKHKISELKEDDVGRIIILNNVSLSLVDEKMVRFISAIRKETFKNMVIEESNNIKMGDIVGILEDYSYILEGICQNNLDENFFIKIPCEIKNEFENKYSINDIIMGNVSIIGIYKGKIKEDIIKKNTFEYLLSTQTIYNDFFNKDNKIRNSKEEYKQPIENNTTDNNVSYVDIIAIIQNIQEKEKEKSTIMNILKKLFSRN